MPEPTYRTIDKFDRMIGQLCRLPDVTHTKPSTIVTNSPLIGEAQTFIVQTYRQREIGDTIFIQYVDSTTSVRLALPPEVADAIARQRDALTTKNRSRTAKRVAAERKANGWKPNFAPKPK